MEKRKIITNKIQCTYCGDIIESVHVHDFKFCKCRAVSVDGGKSYLKRSFKNSPNDYIDLSEYEDNTSDYQERPVPKLKCKKSKQALILEHLKNYGTITSLEAIEKYGATRLAAIIFQLRKKGYNIITIDMPFTDRFGNHSTYGKYILSNSIA